MTGGMDTVDRAQARAEAAEDRLRSQTMLRAEAEHRLKTSLAVIAGWAVTLDERWEQLPEERRREAVAIIRKASQELTDQAGRLLEDARAEMLTLDQDPVVLDLGAVLEVTTTAFSGMPSHTVHAVVPPAPVHVEVDPAALQQILGHLIENAVKYSPDGGAVVVDVRADGDVALLRVLDEGVGVPEDVDVFEPFQRGPDADRLPGVGLGLYIVRNLVRGLGGTVEARRNAGPGSTFEVRLPLVVAI